MDGWTDRRLNGCADRQREGQTDGRTDRKKNKQTGRWTDRQRNRQLGKLRKFCICFSSAHSHFFLNIFFSLSASWSLIPTLELRIIPWLFYHWATAACQVIHKPLTPTLSSFLPYSSLNYRKDWKLRSPLLQVMLLPTEPSLCPMVQNFFLPLFINARNKL